VYSSSQGCHTATGTHMTHGITQCYLPPGRGDIPALTPAEAGTRLSDPGGMQGWVDRSVAFECPRPIACLHRVAMGTLLLSWRSWSVHLVRGRPGGLNAPKQNYAINTAKFLDHLTVCALSCVHSRRTELNWIDLACTKLTQLHDAILVTRVSVGKSTGCRAADREVQFS